MFSWKEKQKVVWPDHWKDLSAEEASRDPNLHLESDGLSRIDKQKFASYLAIIVDLVLHDLGCQLNIWQIVDFLEQSPMFHFEGFSIIGPA